jgi:hypothetical protein
LGKSTQIDFVLNLSNRISVEADYIKKNTDGLLFSVPLALSSGATSINQNIGEVQSSGKEFTLNTKKNMIPDKLKWNTSQILPQINSAISMPNNNKDIIGNNLLLTELEKIYLPFLGRICRS